MPNYTDNEILAMLRSLHPNNRSKALRYLYDKVYAYISAFVVKNGGTASDAEDLFQDSLIAFYEKAITPGFELTSTIKNYLHGISRNMWFKRFRKEKREINVEDISIYVSPLEEDVQEDKIKMLDDSFFALSDGCRRILKLYYYEKKNMTEIAEILGLAGKGVAKNKKARCLSKMKEFFLANKTI